MYLEEERNRELEALFEADVERGGGDGRGKMLSASKAAEGEEGGAFVFGCGVCGCVRYETTRVLTPPHAKCIYQPYHTNIHTSPNSGAGGGGERAGQPAEPAERQGR